MKRIIVFGMAAWLSATLVSYGQQEESSSTGKQQTDQQQSDNNELIGEGNEKKAQPNEDGSNNYRKNAVSGNPNNRTVDEGGNREATNPTMTNESSTGTAPGQNNGSNANNSGNNNNSTMQNSSGTDASGVIERNSSTSGSPAVLSDNKGSGLDGTNTVQRAKPNMVGSKTPGAGNGKRSVDQDEETRRTTMNNQGQPNPGQANQTAENEYGSNVKGDQQKSSESNGGNSMSQKTTSVGKQGNNNTPPAGPLSGSTSKENKNLKQPINSNAEDTNGRDVNDDKVDSKDVKAMDTGTTDLGRKESKGKRHKHRRHKG